MIDNSTPLGADTIGSATETPHGFVDRAREIAGSAQDTLADVGSAMRERAGTTKDSLADVIDSGASKLRATALGGATDGQPAAASPGGSIAVVDDGRIAQVGDKVATGMNATADWLRNADLDGLKASIEEQVKNHPGRTLLVAAGLGYLIGRAIKH
jgi:hypothetical protein